jgi:2-methylisocitrate lyase-like PEP mutase family enzyme
MPNPWDGGSALLLATLGFPALATTSSGFALSLGRRDGEVTADEAIDHGAAIVAAVPDTPVSADLEHGFADDPAGVAATIERAIAAGLAGGSIEDYSRTDIYDAGLARERVAAAAEVAHRGPVHFVLTAPAENLIRGRDDLGDTIARLQSFQEAGADVHFAPGLTTPDDLRSVVTSLDRPVIVLAHVRAPDVAGLAALGVARISVGGSFALAALAGLVEAARELLDAGTYGYTDKVRLARQALAGASERTA